MDSPATSPSAGRDRARPIAPEPSDSELGLAWFLRLRWVAILGQAVAVGVARFVFQQELPYPALLGLIGLTLASNGLLVFWSRVLGSRSRLNLVLGLVLSLDVLLLGSMIALSGGVSNPFTVLFLVHVALSAVLLEMRWTWLVVGLTSATFGALFLLPTSGHAMHGHGPWSGHLLGMWIAYGLAATFVAYFVGKVAHAMRERDQRLAEIAKLAEQNRRLALLSSFSANAAHELGSPLATMNLAAEELASALLASAAPESLQSDANLIHTEVRRCRDILATLSARAGESMGEMPSSLELGRLVEDVLRLVPRSQKRQIEVHFVAPAGADTKLVAPPKTLTQMLHNLIRNAFEAQSETGREEAIELEVAATEQIRFTLKDRGPGLSPAVSGRLGEPFVTTKGEHGGFGLGVYLARSYAERTGGALSFRGREGGGVEVELRLPRNALEFLS
jgi:two-component system, sensor histidine kinase RegB